MSDSLRPHEPQHARPPCPSPTPGVHPNPCPLSQWCHPTNSSSVVPFSSCPQSFPASGSLKVSHCSLSGSLIALPLINELIFKIFIYLTASGLSCGTWRLWGITRDLSLWCKDDSLVVVRGLTGCSCPTACGVFPDQGLNPCPCSGRWFFNPSTTREVPF